MRALDQHALDQHAWSNRWCECHPLEKLLPALALLLLTICSPSLVVAPLVIALTLSATVWGAGVPLRTFAQVMFVPATFLLVGAPFLALSVDFNSTWNVRWSPEGVQLALQTTLRALAAVSCLALLTLTTPLADWIPLVRRIGVPTSVVELILLMYRLIFVFAERASTAYQAQTTRLGYTRFDRSVHSLGLLAGNLFQRALDRARHLEIGLAARGYTGELRVLSAERPVSWRRLGLALLLVGGVGLLANWLASVLP